MSSSKRRPLDSPTSPNSKRRKNEGQSCLDLFFSPSPSKVKSVTKVSPKQPIPNDREIIDVDSLDDHHNYQDSVSLSQTSGTASVQLLPTKFIQTQHGSNETSAPQYTSLAVDTSAYDPQNAFIPPSNGTPYSFLAHALSTVNATRSRITILDTLTNYFRTILVHDSQSLLPSLYLLSNTLSPPYSALELNIGPSIISRAIQQVSGLPSASLKKLYSSSGDPGDVAFIAKSNTRTLLPHPPLLVTFVYKSLMNIAACRGQGATKDKQKIIEKLLVSAKGEEIRFLVRTLSQNLRVGAVRTSLLTALARCFVLTPLPAHREPVLSCSPPLEHSYIQPIVAAGSKHKEASMEIARRDLQSKFRLAEHLLRMVFVRHPNYDHIIGALLEGGLDDLVERVPLTVGIPVYPALGSPIRSFDEVFEKLNDMHFAAELKYDGQRAQIHVSRQLNGHIDIRVFSRHLEDMTSKYPDVTALMQALFETHQDTQSLIIDSEIVAIDSTTGSLKSFQALSGRARKDVTLQEVKIPVAVFAFDLIYLDGENLLERSFRARRTLLRTRFPAFIPENKLFARFQHVESCDSEQGQVPLQDFWERVIGRHDTEGLMVKLLDNEVRDDDNTEIRTGKLLSAVYDADKRTFSWMKLKKDYVSGLGDSLDLIPIGAWYGNGRKVKWWSPVLLGIWDPARGHPVAVCKCMSGFTDAFYKNLSQRYSLDDVNNCSKIRLWDCETGGLKPDVYFKPQEVWEIRGADITLSPVSIAAQHLTSSSRGLSLRFPRFIKLRDDKSITQASDALFLTNMWKSQQGKPQDDDEDELIDVGIDSATEYSENDTSSSIVS